MLSFILAWWCSMQSDWSAPSRTPEPLYRSQTLHVRLNLIPERRHWARIQSERSLLNWLDNGLMLLHRDVVHPLKQGPLTSHAGYCSGRVVISMEWVGQSRRSCQKEKGCVSSIVASRGRDEMTVCRIFYHSIWKEMRRGLRLHPPTVALMVSCIFLAAWNLQIWCWCRMVVDWSNDEWFLTAGDASSAAGSTPATAPASDLQIDSARECAPKLNHTHFNVRWIRRRTKTHVRAATCIHKPWSELWSTCQCCEVWRMMHQASKCGLDVKSSQMLERQDKPIYFHDVCLCARSTYCVWAWTNSSWSSVSHYWRSWHCACVLTPKPGIQFFCFFHAFACLLRCGMKSNQNTDNANKTRK